ncbi:xylulokinase [Cohnella abietis]|uniref:Xylulokinase n=1 Tax=Cohnella abietis TaxID=2507935 RepID=A0A3T1D677_9BACL|nr:FGGY family carbohydrate kinase [Cohnella abietis]BBI33569.1 xylulokinase [Cohnella abietis]
MTTRTKAVLSLDIGSSSCKAALIDAQGRFLAESSAAYRIHNVKEGWFNQNPDEIWEGASKAIRGLFVGQAGSDNKGQIAVAALCLSSQIGSYMLVDRDNKPLTDFLSWMDTRAVVESEEMKKAFTEAELRSQLGMDIPVGPNWVIPKLRWFNRHHPDLLERASLVVQPKEWVIWNLTGSWMSDQTSAKGCVHQQSLKPASKLLEWAGAGPDIVPPIGLPHDIAGTLIPAVADRLGLPSGIPVVLGWNDMSAALLGLAGLPDRLTGFDITGTSEHVGLIEPGLFSPVPKYVEGMNWVPLGETHRVIYGVTSTGGQALKWFVEQIDQYGKNDINSSVDYDTILRQAGSISAGSEGLLFLPYLSGERSPWWNPAARGVFFGLNPSHDRSHMARAVMEGVGYALCTMIDRLPVKPANMLVAGGSSRNRLWNQIKANQIGVPFSRLETTEAGCLGAAILAAYALGWYSSLRETGNQMIRIAETYEPDRSVSSIYEEGYGRFVDLYHALVPVFSRESSNRDIGGSSQ